MLARIRARQTAVKRIENDIPGGIVGEMRFALVRYVGIRYNSIR